VANINTCSQRFQLFFPLLQNIETAASFT